MLTEFTFYFFKFKKDEYKIKKMLSLILLILNKAVGETKIKEIFNIVYNKINEFYKCDIEDEQEIVDTIAGESQDSSEALIVDNQNILCFNNRDQETDQKLLDGFIQGQKSEAFLEFLRTFYNAGAFDKTLTIENSALQNLRNLTYKSNRPAAIVNNEEIKLIEKMQKRLSDYNKRING